MKIYRKLIPRIAKDVVRSLLASRAVEVEDGRRDEAELDVAAVFVGYLNEVDRVTADAHDALNRHNLGMEHFGRIKRSMAQARNLPLAEDALDHVLGQLVTALFESRYVQEVYAEDPQLRSEILVAMKKYLGVDEELDREVRGRLKNLREGTAEWEIEYGRLIEQMRGRQADYVGGP
jgi:hypothetical protein